MVDRNESPVQAPRRVVVVGASAGGVPALTRLVAALDPGLRAALLVVLHIPENARSVLPEILERAGPLPAAHPRDREPIVAGHIYVAPPARHLLVDEGVVRLTRGPWENGFRPSIDALFRSAAHWYAKQVVGVVLSGALFDGAAGLAAVAANGGVAIVQDPTDAIVPDMPNHSLESVPDAQSLTIDAIAERIGELVTGDVPERREPSGAAPYPDIDAAKGLRTDPEENGGDAAGLICPDCGGSLFVVDQTPLLRFRCRVGHGWTADALAGTHVGELERALWVALRVLEEHQAVQQRLIVRARESGRTGAATRMDRQRVEQDRLVATLRGAVARFEALDADAQPDDADPLGRDALHSIPDHEPLR